MALDKRNLKIATLLVAAAIIFFFIFQISQTTYNLITFKETVITINDSVIPVALADTYTKRVEGLSGRDSLPEGTGLLFVFEKSDLHGIWMRDMNFAIDILWINEDGKVVHIEENVPPESYPKVFKPDEPARYVLEVNAGFAAERGIQEGDLTDFDF